MIYMTIDYIYVIYIYINLYIIFQTKRSVQQP